MTYTGRRPAQPEALGSSPGDPRNGAAGGGVGRAGFRGDYPVDDGYGSDGYGSDGYGSGGYAYGYGYGYGDRTGGASSDERDGPARYDRYRAGRSGAEAYRPQAYRPDGYRSDDGYGTGRRDPRAVTTGSGRSLPAGPSRPAASQPSDRRRPALEAWPVAQSRAVEGQRPTGGEDRPGRAPDVRPHGPTRPHDGAPRAAGPVRTPTGEFQRPIGEARRPAQAAGPETSGGIPMRPRPEAGQRRSRRDGSPTAVPPTGAVPLSRREARARETGSLSRRMLGARASSPASGEIPVPFGLGSSERLAAITGPLQLSAPVQRIRALLADWSGEGRDEGRADDGPRREGHRADSVGGSRRDHRSGADTRADERTSSRTDGRGRNRNGDRADDRADGRTDDRAPGRGLDRADGRGLDRADGRTPGRGLDRIAPVHELRPSDLSRGQASRSRRERGDDLAPRRSRQDRAGSYGLDGVRRLDEPATGALALAPAPVAREAGPDGLRAWIDRSRRNSRTRPETDERPAGRYEDPEDEGPENDHRRQLLTSVLALGGLGITGWVASRVAGEGNAAITPSPPATADVAPAGVVNGGQTSTAAAVNGAQPASVVLNYGEIDDQHDRVGELIDQVEEAMRSGASRRKQAAALNDLLAWTKVHFAFEEALMDTYDLAGTSAHKANHRAFVAKLGAFVKSFVSGKADLTPDVISMVRTWHRDHIASDDQHLVNELNARGIPSAV